MLMHPPECWDYKYPVSGLWGAGHGTRAGHVLGKHSAGCGLPVSSPVVIIVILVFVHYVCTCVEGVVEAGEYFHLKKCFYVNVSVSCVQGRGHWIPWNWS